MRANESVSGEGEGGGPQAGLRLRLSIPGATVSCTPRRCCVSVLQRARHSCVSRARTHTHAYACTQVERHIRGFTWPCTHALARHTYTRGIVERCAYVHEARARVPRSTHLFLSVRDTRRYLATEATATVRRHACVYRNQPAFRRYTARVTRGAILSSLRRRGRREREETSSGISSGISYESSSIAGLRDIGIVIEEDRGPSDETRFWIYSAKWISFDRTELVR